MRTHLLTPLLAGVVVFTPMSPLAAALFNRAEVSRVHNQVTLVDPAAGRRPAVVRDVVAGNVALQTGLESRAELRFPDSTLTRLASNTVFSFRSGTREMDLKSGAILFQVPSGSGGAEIHAAAITAAITGTTGFVERVGNVYKLIVLEGDVRTYIRNRVGESMIVRGGQMLIAPLNSTSVRGWQTVDVDVEKLLRSSALLNRKLFGPLSPQALADINRVASNQESAFRNGRLNRTNLVIDGGVSQVIMVDNQTRTRTDTQPTPPPAPAQSIAGGPRPTPPPDPIVGGPNPPQPLPTPISNPTPNPNPTATPNPNPSATPGTITRPDPYVISRATSIVTRGDRPTITTDEVTNTGRSYRGNAQDGSASQFVFGSTSGFDLRSNFDERFGRNTEPEFAPNGVAVFRFGSVRIVGPPALDLTGGSADLALIAANVSNTTPGIVTGGPGGVWDLSGLRSLFLGTAGSSLMLDNPVAFSASGGTFRFLHLYARGEESDTLLGAVTYLVGDLFVDSERDTLMNVRADVVARRLILSAGRDIRMEGLTNATFTQLHAGRTLQIGGRMNSTEFFAFGRDAQVSGMITADYVNFQLTGEFVSSGSGSKISAREFVLTADSFMLNPDEGGGTTFDMTKLARLELNVRRLTLGGDFTMPAGTAAIFNLGNIDAPLRGLFGIASIVTTGSGKDQLRDLSAGSFTAANSLLVSRDVSADNLTASNNIVIGRDLLPYSADSALPRSITADRIGIGRGINFAGADGASNPATAPGNGFSLDLFASRIIFSDDEDDDDDDDDNEGRLAIGGANLNGGDAAPASGLEGGSGGTLNIGSESAPIAGDVHLNAPITATTGRNANSVDFGGRGGSVNVVANGTITARSEIQTSGKTQRRESRTGGNVRLTSRKLSGTAIRVASTAQIASLLAAGAPGPGGEVVFRSAGGDIDISGTVTADRGRVEIQNTGANGRIALNGARISADVVKARAFGENGLLTINGGTLSADSMLKLYADGSNGTVLFSGNVSLNGNSTKIITGNTVTISPNVIVTIGGPTPAQVYTNNANYTGFGGNNSSTGTFAGAGATTQPRALAPGY